jgi:hypothetical protein
VVIAICLPLAIYGAYWYVKKHSGAGTAHAAEVAPASASSASGGWSLGGKGGEGAKDSKTMSREEWIHRQVPRVAGIPWSAPIYDDQKPQAQPDLYCVEWVDVNDAKKCRCLTEQGTHAEVPYAMCVAFAEGGVYNPYRAPLPKQAAPQSASPAAETPAASGVAVAMAAMAGGGPEGGKDRERQTATPYVPPTYGNWNPDPWGPATAR